jgi:hypothetical protein
MEEKDICWNDILGVLFNDTMNLWDFIASVMDELNKYAVLVKWYWQWKTEVEVKVSPYHVMKAERG